jgi:hypothetical protein
MTTQTPARLFVLLAREAPVGVIFRRGPTEWTQMILWDTKNDVYTPGQWMKARIFERLSGLSPDGQLLIYAVSKSGNASSNPNYLRKSDYGTGWTAVSRPPYFTALALWPHTIEGGFFVDNRTVYVSSWATHPDHEPVGLEFVPNAVETDWFTLNGWINLRDPFRNFHVKDDQAYLSISQIKTWRKDVDDFGFSLVVKDVNATYGKKRLGRRLDNNLEYLVVDRSTNQESSLKDVVWADFDQQKRLVLAKAGKLFSACVREGELSYTELADFNANTPEAIESPDWAKKW